MEPKVRPCGGDVGDAGAADDAAYACGVAYVRGVGQESKDDASAIIIPQL